MNTLHCSEGSDDIRWPRHHVSAGEDSRLGNQLTEFTARDKVHIVAMTGSYNRQTDQNGTERYGCELVAEQVDFLAKAKQGSQGRRCQSGTGARLRQSALSQTSALEASEITFRRLPLRPGREAIAKARKCKSTLNSAKTILQTDAPFHAPKGSTTEGSIGPLKAPETEATYRASEGSQTLRKHRCRGQRC